MLDLEANEKIVTLSQLVLLNQKVNSCLRIHNLLLKIQFRMSTVKFLFQNSAVHSALASS